MRLLKYYFFIWFTISTGLSLMAQSFVPHNPDTTLLKQREKSEGYIRPLGYYYLSQYYEEGSGMDSIVYYPWNDTMICSFKQDFVPNIRYEMFRCSEFGMIGERIIFPKIEIDTLRVWLEKLYYHPDNKWHSPYEYLSNGEGCWYEITETDLKTIINVTCGN